MNRLALLKSNRFFLPGVLFIIMLAGFLVRLDDLRSWKERPDQAFLQGEPLLTTFDGYFYLNLSRDLLDQKYLPKDDKQIVPEGRYRPYPPPLLSVLGAFFTKATGLSLNWVGVILPPILGVLLALPLYYLGNYMGGMAMGFSAALVSLFFPYYVYRSNIGWFDTDCLNVTFATAIVYFLLKFAKQTEKQRYLYFGASILFYLLFLWWWDQAFAVVSVIFLSTLLVALIGFYRPNRQEGYLFYGLLAGLAIMLLTWQGFDLPLRIYNTILYKFEYIYTSKTVAGVFPNQSITVSEQVRPGFDEIVSKSTGSLPIFLAACLGLFYLFYRRPKDSLFLITPLLLASLSFLFAKRFLIFLNPITALGLGSCIGFIWAYRKKYKGAAIIAPGLLCLFVCPPLSANLSMVHWPKEPGALVAGMAAAGKATPEDAVIWTWWDHGYNMRYFADRGVIADGSYHSGEISLYNAFPFSVHDDRLAANFIQFYVSRGQKGMSDLYDSFNGEHTKALYFLQKVLAGGPALFKEILAEDGPKVVEEEPENFNLKEVEFYFPVVSRPVYLFLDWRLTITSYWWYWFGSWDFEKRQGQHPSFTLFQNVSIAKNQINGFNSSGRMVGDLTKGVVSFGGRVFPMKRLSIFGTDGQVKVGNFNQTGYFIDVSPANRLAAMVDDKMANSVFNRLYIRGTYDSTYFSPVIEKMPVWQLWRVKGDSPTLSQ